MEIVTGYVEHIVFRNEENGYTVFQLESEAGEVTCVGTLNFISEGERLEIKGDYVNHNIYGSQLKISSYEMKEPEDLISIERYLGSGAIKGVGAALAGRIVRKFKTDTCLLYTSIRLLIIVNNKNLAVQLYGEFKESFPEIAVE